jgi:hypothetical protein
MPEWARLVFVTRWFSRRIRVSGSCSAMPMPPLVTVGTAAAMAECEHEGVKRNDGAKILGIAAAVGVTPSYARVTTRASAQFFVDLRAPAAHAWLRGLELAHVSRVIDFWSLLMMMLVPGINAQVMRTWRLWTTLLLLLRTLTKAVPQTLSLWRTGHCPCRGLTESYKKIALVV